MVLEVIRFSLLVLIILSHYTDIFRRTFHDMLVTLVLPINTFCFCNDLSKHCQIICNIFYYHTPENVMQSSGYYLQEKDRTAVICSLKYLFEVLVNSVVRCIGINIITFVIPKIPNNSN